jgi:energy-coupling factor transporter ATP-binding protein EcfA2
VTHDVAASAEFDEVWLLQDGRLIERGAPRELLQRDSRYAAWHRAEAELRAELGDGARFRRLRLERGRLVEERAS